MDASPELDTTAPAFYPKCLSSPNSTLSTGNPPIKWHNFHCDPILDIVLVANDGIHLRASSHALMRESSLFKGMLSSMPNSYQSPSDGIPLDFSGDTIAIFLNSNTTDSPPRYDDLSFAVLHKQRQLVLYLDCDRLLPTLEDAYSVACDNCPIQWLVLASKDDDIVAGISALLRCHQIYAPTHYAGFRLIVDQLRPSWQYPLLKRVLLSREGSSADSNRIDWPGQGAVISFAREVERAKEESKRG